LAYRGERPVVWDKKRLRSEMSKETPASLDDQSTVFGANDALGADKANFAGRDAAARLRSSTWVVRRRSAPSRRKARRPLRRQEGRDDAGGETHVESHGGNSFRGRCTGASIRFIRWNAQRTENLRNKSTIPAHSRRRFPIFARLLSLHVPQGRLFPLRGDSPGRFFFAFRGRFLLRNGYA
jgi:hypothetical protein